MGKGSARRPASVSEQQVAENWARIFTGYLQDRFVAGGWQNVPLPEGCVIEEGTAARAGVVTNVAGDTITVTWPVSG